MEEIRNKKLSGGLRHVTEEDKVKPKPAEGRDALLDQIRTGVTLKKVDMDAASSGAASSNSNEGGGIACLLQRALQERNNAVCQSSTDDDDSEYDDDDWDD